MKDLRETFLTRQFLIFSICGIFAGAMASALTGKHSNHISFWIVAILIDIIFWAIIYKKIKL